MASAWYYTRSGQKEGPVSSQELKQLAEFGQLQPSDMVWKEGMANWMPASRIKGLFAISMEQAATAQTTQSPAPGLPPPIARIAWYKRKWVQIGSICLALILASCLILTLVGKPGNRGTTNFAGKPPYAHVIAELEKKYGPELPYEELPDIHKDRLAHERKWSERVETWRKMKNDADPMLVAIDPPPITLDASCGGIISAIEVQRPTYNMDLLRTVKFPVVYTMAKAIGPYNSGEKFCVKCYDVDGALLGESGILLANGSSDAPATPALATVAGHFFLDTSKLDKVASFKLFCK